MAGFLGLPAGLFGLGRSSFRRPLGCFQAIPEGLAPAPLADERLFGPIGSIARLSDPARRHGHHPLVVGPEGVALGDNGLLGAICPPVRLCESGFDYSHEPVVLCSKAGALGSFSLFGAVSPRFGLGGPHIRGCQLLAAGRTSLFQLGLEPV